MSKTVLCHKDVGLVSFSCRHYGFSAQACSGMFSERRFFSIFACHSGVAAYMVPLSCHGHVLRFHQANAFLDSAVSLVAHRPSALMPQGGRLSGATERQARTHRRKCVGSGGNA